ncbi:hypothetical protein D9M73_261690 [compost metagenome]
MPSRLLAMASVAIAVLCKAGGVRSATMVPEGPTMPPPTNMARPIMTSCAMPTGS